MTTRIVSTMFKMRKNQRTKKTELKGYLPLTLDDGYRVLCYVLPSNDTPIRPEIGDICIVQIDTDPDKALAKWHHKKEDGSETPAMLVTGDILCKIQVPAEVRFDYQEGRNVPIHRVPEKVNDVTIVYQPDHCGFEPQRGELWKIKPTNLYQYFGEKPEGSMTIGILMECTERVVSTPKTETAATWAALGTLKLAGQKKAGV
jgi:hypothetical protein